MAIPVAIAAVVGLIARKGSQEAIKKFGKEAVKQAQKYTARKKTKLKKSNAETMKKVEQQKIEEGVVTPAPGEEKIIGEETERITTDTIPEPKFRNMEEYQEYLKKEQEKLFKRVPVEELGANKTRSGRG